jgi:hypothetical protein
MKGGQRSDRKLGDISVVCASGRVALVVCLAVVWTLVIVCAVHAQAPNGQHGGNGKPGGGHSDGRPTYQRRGLDWKDKGHKRRREHFQRSWNGPQVSNGWFQRPYPYHLDYYKMRWGGSYAPYFGNLYGTPFGTPAVVYGGWGLGAGEWGPNVQPQGVEGSVWVPYALPQGAVMEQVEDPIVRNGTVQPGNENLPAPSK